MEQTANQLFHLILADIAMAAAIRTYDRDDRPTFPGPPAGPSYSPGALRDAWLARTADALLRQRVTAMANAALASLQGMPGDRLAAVAENYGVPLPTDQAEQIAAHFAARREAPLTYRR